MENTMTKTYAGPYAGLPPQTDLSTDTAIFTEAYAVIPASTMRDIVTSFLPGWTGMRMWIIARPLSGFAETFSQYVVELAPEGGSARPEDDAGVVAEGVTGAGVRAGSATSCKAGSPSANARISQRRTQRS